ncbi:D-3-phosphoglycerate dehydrogenase [Geodermatophilus telluris]|uniref:D-3-phosphoglycerate dehydrogenase n=1 Tax=Geodermatophilus telluris TaxID=1190417 RepID=A0A1G6L600_9ACTN|nr:NAD(P)-dependent oxidoreductase [Geodermatophilus telluris]SDC38674.1 D-3-phosphoglycerate dehydrogenase [Geodermatophilus telluris]
MKILLASSIDPTAIEALEADHDVVRAFNAPEEQLVRLVPDREAVVFRSGVRITAAVLDAAPNLALLVRAGSGLDNVDIAAAGERGVRVVRVPGSSAQPVAELTFALLLSLVRKVSLADRLLRDGHWPKSQLGGPLLAGKTLGIVGAGRIGSRVGEMGAAWGMRAIGCVDNDASAAASALAARGIALTDFDTVVTEADFLCLHLPLDERTHHIIDAHVLSRMKQGSFLVNVARGGVVDESALYPELTEGGKLLGAALDVHEHEGEGVVSPFAALPNVVLTPHIGAMAWDSQRLIGERVVELLGAHERGCLDESLTAEELVPGSGS